MDIKGIIEAIRSGVTGIQILGQDVNRIDEEIETVATTLGFRVKEWNLGYGWVDFKTKKGSETGSRRIAVSGFKSHCG
ncbi:hypothetical protein LNP44_00135 [Klebsiella pneumoniae subsp. pneumoniae]|nr:hypothetical protein [Klebsiella pneumoniae subsp. pneumoniae]